MKLTDKEILSLAKSAPKVWRDYEGGRATLLDFARKVIKAELEKQAAGWQPIETAPKTGRILLADAYFVSEGSWYEGWQDGPDEMGRDSGFVDAFCRHFTAPRTFGAPAYQHAGRQPIAWMHLPSSPIGTTEGGEG